MSFNELKKHILGDIIDIKHGFAFKGEFFSQTETEDVLLSPGNFKIGGGFKDDKFKYYNGKYPKEYILKENDIIVTMTDLSKEGDTLGYSAKIPSSENKKYLHNQRLGLVQFKNDDFDKDFIYWLLRTKEYQSFIVNSATGTTVKHTAPTRIKEYEFLAPVKTTQTKISKILTSIDDKIEFNRQTNQTLEALAQTLFKEMCLSKSEILPDGWRVEKLDNLIETVSITHKMKQEEIIFLNTSDILEGNVLNRDYSIVSSLPGQAKKSIKRNDILFSEIRPANKRYAFVNFDADDYVVSTKLMVLRSKGINPYLIYCYLTNNDTLKELQHLAETRSGTFPQITFSQLKDFQIVIPDEETLEKVSKNIQDIYENIFLNNKETQTLIALRDSLLPKLMKGEIVL